ncbi:alkyl/aryl-sulfatase [Amycolatopsis dendrobii]|uniref:Linear primary-alkylsulfatase n=1 Tax=Amycolatopsis dendrobii TaxID=2760662 RepID=A0A7W3W3P4_9PSEU|nr:alkyl sulfatase dimerization domain-containing protein [Amycolatopsis dendrobii]MBB1158149.1 MBL fold metallo-hydrolase [Amycolatopsis dendrobii]
MHHLEPNPYLLRRCRQLLDELPFADRSDFDDASRGFVAGVEPSVVRGPNGRVVWDVDAYQFLDGDAPDTVNPSLWRQSQLVAKHGLFEVAVGLYQVRGLDISNVTFIEGASGVIVVDPLVSVETARAALELYRRHRGERPVTGVIYTHSHVDHFGGVKGVTTQEDVDAGRVPVIAPSGFLEHAVSENVYVGTAMVRRATYMYGTRLERGARGQVGAGLGPTTSGGTVSLIPPTVEVSATGQTLSVDGVEFVFQMAPGAEAPSEFHFYLPDRAALCVAENATRTMHNVLTLRGALVRDARAWAAYLTETLDLWGGEAEVVFAGHHWPTWGADRVVEYLSLQRDLYAYLHDQTVRMMNQGLVGSEIAETFALPPALEKAWHARGYYGSVSHNVKAVYQRYLGWYDGNPAHLWQHPPEESAKRLVADLGGAAAVLAKARAYADAGDYRWAAELADKAVFADQSNVEARQLLADIYEQLGYGAENGTWRCVYLTGAQELRHGMSRLGQRTASLDILQRLSPAQIFDAVAIRVDGPRCWAESLVLDVVVVEAGERYRLTLRNGVLVTSRPRGAAAEATLTVASAKELVSLFAASGTPEIAETLGVKVEGDSSVLKRLLASLETPNPNFAIVTPD